MTQVILGNKANDPDGISREASMLALLNTEAPEDIALKCDLEAVESNLQRGIRSNLSLPTELADRVLKAGGKRIRPFLMCATYRSCQNLLNLDSKTTADDLHTLAAVAEWVHTATLFHDDVLDASVTRRGLPTAHVLEGNKVAILVGDFVYVEAFALLMERGLLNPSRELAHTIKRLVEGELLQHREVMNRGYSYENYQTIALAKTAALFEWCTSTGAWAAGFKDLVSAKNFGKHLGYAFQLIDDVIDTFEFDAHNENPEKILEWIESSAPFPIVALAIGNESLVEDCWKKLAENQLTLPEQRALIFKLQQNARNSQCANFIKNTIESSLTDAEKILGSLGKAPALNSALEIIRTRATVAFELLRAN